MHRQPTSHPQRQLANLCTCQKPISYLDLRAAVHNLNNQPFGRKCSYAAIPPAGLKPPQGHNSHWRRPYCVPSSPCHLLPFSPSFYLLTFLHGFPLRPTYQTSQILTPHLIYCLACCRHFRQNGLVTASCCTDGKNWPKLSENREDTCPRMI